MVRIDRSYLEHLVVLFLVVCEQRPQLLRFDSEDLLRLVLEAGHPLVAGHVRDAEGQDDAPREAVVLHVALLATVEPVVLVKDLEIKVKCL